MAPLVEQWSLSVFLRVAVMLLPAFYCSWTAFCLTLKITAAADNKVVWAVTTTTTEFTIGTRSSAPLLQAPTRRTVVVVAEENQTDSRTQEIADAAINSAASKCFPFNSVEWLAGPRQGNSDNGGDNLLERIVGNGRFSPASGSSLLRPILEQSVCGSQSPFLGNSLHRTINQGLTTPQENAAVRLWTARLLYLVVYEHQHRPAVLEAEQRKKKEYIQHLCPHAAKDYGIGAFDFECPSAQFLVVSFYHNGIGANLRLAAVPALMVGIATGRVVLFVNHATKGPAFLREPWTLASCDHRRDSQCFFRPASPCVLTEAELDTAYTLQRSEMRRFVRFGQMPEKHADDRVLILHLSFRPQRQPENLRTVLYNRTTALIDRLVVADNLLPSALLYKAADAILVGDEPPVTNFNYYGAGSQIFHSLLLYAMRPNARAAAQMDAILQEVLPTNFVADEALGLPIRASDKCAIESECLTFSQYMTAAKELWSKHVGGVNTPPSPMSVIVTSESKQVLREQANYSFHQPSSLHADSFPIRFVTNHLDVFQDTGYLKDVINTNIAPFTADQAMLSAISSLKLQLLTRVTLGNCCSNFHLLLKDLLDTGCGATIENSFQCLQDDENPEFRVCCAWDRSPLCQARRKQRKEN